MAENEMQLDPCDYPLIKGLSSSFVCPSIFLETIHSTEIISHTFVK